VHQYGHDLAIAAACACVKRRLARPETAQFSQLVARPEARRDNRTNYTVTGRVTAALPVAVTDQRGQPTTGWQTLSFQSTLIMSGGWDRQRVWYVPSVIPIYTILDGDSFPYFRNDPDDPDGARERAAARSAVLEAWRKNPNGR